MLPTFLSCCLHGPACARRRMTGCFGSHVQGAPNPPAPPTQPQGGVTCTALPSVTGASTQCKQRRGSGNRRPRTVLSSGVALMPAAAAGSASARCPTQQPPPFAGPQPRRRGRPQAPPPPRAGPMRARRRAWRCRGGRRTQTARRPAPPAGAGRWAAPAHAEAAGNQPGTAGQRGRRQHACCCPPAARRGAARVQARGAHARPGGRLEKGAATGATHETLRRRAPQRRARPGRLSRQGPARPRGRPAC